MVPTVGFPPDIPSTDQFTFPFAINCAVPLNVKTATRGFMENPAITVSDAVPVTEPEAAVMVTDPCATPVATPDVLTVATAGFEQLQLTVVVMSCEVPSL